MLFVLIFASQMTFGQSDAGTQMEFGSVGSFDNLWGIHISKVGEIKYSETTENGLVEYELLGADFRYLFDGNVRVNSAYISTFRDKTVGMTFIVNEFSKKRLMECARLTFGPPNAELNLELDGKNYVWVGGNTKYRILIGGDFTIVWITAMSY